MQTTFTRLLHDACAGTEISISSHADGWLHLLERERVTRVVIGHVFDRNRAGVADLVDDKCALALFLDLHGLPHVPHAFVSAYLPDGDGWRLGAVGEEGALAQVGALPFGPPYVVKPVRGTGGRDVDRADTIDEAAALVRARYEVEGTAAVCPLLDVTREVRAVVLDGEVLCMLDKVRSDDWRHNLSRGARAEELADVPDALTDLALDTARQVGVDLATIDCVEVDGRWLVLEINKGTKLVSWSVQGEDERRRAVEVYRSIVRSLF